MFPYHGYSSSIYFFYGMECSPIMGNYSLIFYTSYYIYLKPIGFIFVLEKIVSFPKD